MVMTEFFKVNSEDNVIEFDWMSDGSLRESNGYQVISGSKRFQETDEYSVLNFTVHHADDIDNPSLYPSVRERVYVVVFSIEPGIEYHTIAAMGLPDPVWRQQFRIDLNDCVDNYEFISVEVVRLYSQLDPGSSSCRKVVGRAKIPLPMLGSRKKEGRFGLVRFEEEGCRAEGHIVVSMEVEKIKYY